MAVGVDGHANPSVSGPAADIRNRLAAFEERAHTRMTKVVEPQSLEAALRRDLLERARDGGPILRAAYFGRKHEVVILPVLTGL